MSRQRLSKRFFVPNRTGASYNNTEDVYSHQLRDALGALLFDAGRWRRTPSISVTAEATELRNLSSFLGGDKHSRPLDQICRFAERCSETALVNRIAAFEVVVGEDDGAGTRLERIAGAWLPWHGRWLEQIIPDGAHVGDDLMEQSTLTRGMVVRLPLDRVVYQVIPSRIRRTFRRLTFLARDFGKLTDFEATSELRGWDFTAANKLHLRRLARASADVGWNANGRFAELQTDLHYAYRAIVFEECRAELRRDAIRVVQRGAELGRVTKAPLVIECAPSPDLLLTLKTELLSGSVAPADCVTRLADRRRE